MAVRMVHTHHREAAGESWVESLVGGQARQWWAVPTSHGWSRVRVRQVVRGCVLEGDANAAARGVFDGLFGLGTEAVALQAATGRSHGGEVGIREHA